MYMKHILTGCLALAFISFFAMPLHANNGEDDGEKIVIEDLKTEADIVAAQNILAERVDRLQAEKKMVTTKSERKELRNEINEVKSDINAVNKAAKRMSGGIYLGAGALLAIIIVLLLI